MSLSATETPPPGGVEPLGADGYRELLIESRERTLALVAPVAEIDMDRVHDPLMSPLVWDLGHIAAFEDLWLCQRAGGLEPLREELSIVYDASETPRADRGDLPYLRVRDATEYMEAVRERALDVLARSDLGPDSDRLNADGFVWDMLVQHEHQHSETMLQTLKLAAAGTYEPTRSGAGTTPLSTDPGAMTRVAGGPFEMGVDPGDGFSYDNERPRRALEVGAFEIDILPVSNGQFAEFVEDGGYARRELWNESGWNWRAAEGVERPLFWTADGAERSFDRTEAIRPELPVMHVSWFEASAFARWAGKRLPTETEWEKAAAWDPRTGRSLRFPWGDEVPSDRVSNLDQLSFGPAPVAAYPAGVAPSGVLGMIGDAWEWTASTFCGHAGFQAFPYPDYSEVFFEQGYRVLRGGSWATRPRVIRASFRNWDHPQRRQIHAGFRCARDVEGPG